MSILSNNFYYQPLKIDSVNTKVYGDFIAKEGDANGRGLLVTLTENGLQKDTTGITLNLKWAHTTVSGLQNLDPFEAVDLTKGLYKITYPTDMLRKGKVDAFIQIIDSGKLIGSRNIKINVEATVGDDTAIESSNEFRALASALVEVNGWNDRIDAVEADFIQRANDMEATYPQELLSLGSQLAEKADLADLPSGAYTFKGSTTFAALPTTGNILGDVRYTTDNFVNYAWTGSAWTPIGNGAFANGTVTNLKLANSAVTPQKTSFFELGTNVFNKDTVTADSYVRVADGVIVSSGGFAASDFIEVSQSSDYRIKSVRHYVFYDANKVFVSGANGTPSGQTVTSPANAKYMRFSFLISECALGVQQVNAGNVLLAYAPYQFSLPIELQEKRPIVAADLIDGLTTFITHGKNLFDKTKATIGYFVSQTTGAVSSNAVYDVSEFIGIEANKPYYISKTSNIRVAFYDANKTFISGVAFPTLPVTSHANAVYIRFSYDTGGSPQIEQNSIATGYEAYGYTFSRKLNAPKDLAADIVLPPKLYGLVGQELNIYFDNILNDKDTKYEFDVTCTIGAQFENYYRVTPTVAGTYPITIKVLQDNLERAAVTSSIVVTAATVGSGVNKKIMIIGDSTTDNGIAVTKLNDNFNADVMDIQTIGTRGTAPNKHEGRSGWTARHYMTLAVDQADATVVNSFWNPNTSAFDFAYCMTTNSLTVDYVGINLGINDMFSYDDDASLQARITETLGQFQTMIDGIKAYNANIKIGVVITIPPNYSQDAFARSYANGQTRWRYKRNNFLWVKALILAFSGKEADNIYLVPININLDTRNNFPLDGISPSVPVNARNASTVKNFAANAGVHPDTSGYWQIADVFWFWLKSFEV